MGKTTTLNVRVTPEVKKGAEEILSQLGLPMSTAIEMYLKQIAMTGGIPFSIILPEDFECMDVEEIGKSEEKPFEVNSEDDLLEAFNDNKKFIVIKGGYEREVKDLLGTKLSDKEMMGFELGFLGMGSITAEIIYQIINTFSQGTKERKKLESKIRNYNMKRNANNEMLLYWRQMDY